MTYTTERKAPYWVEVYKGKSLAATCVRIATGTWMVISNNKKKDIIASDLRTAKDAFDAFVSSKKNSPR